jgi:type VI secretion system FHA domain protein
MRLTLSVLRCPSAATPETRTISGGELSVGRGPGVDWVLADPEQSVSRRHFTVAFRGGDWQVIDNSSNGTFSNRDETAIGKGNHRILRNHDRLRAGPYEIEVHLEAADRPGYGGGDSGAYQPSSFTIPEDFDDPFRESFAPLDVKPGFGSAFGEHTQPDHSSVLNDAMRPPAQIGQMPVHTGGIIPEDDLLSDDWDKDLLEGIVTPAPATPPRPVAPPSQPPMADPFATPPAPAAANPFHAPSPADPAASPAAVPAPDRPPVTAPPASPPPAADASLMAAFMAGVGLRDVTPADPPATLQRLGEAFRALVSGLRTVMIARASIKSEFRIEQTMIRARGNNPLKFSADDDDAISALIGVGRRTDITPAAAVADALRDIKLHELASIAAMQSAVRTMLDGLHPDRLRAMAEQGGGMNLLAAQRKARAWDTYEAQHARTVRALSDDFDSVFGKAFARAYEEALQELSARERR